MYPQPTESDSLLFRDRVPQWRERYLEKRMREIATLLGDECLEPSDRFWKAKEQMDEQARILVECLDDHRRSTMGLKVLLMYRHGFILDAELETFSDAFREGIQSWLRGEEARH